MTSAEAKALVSMLALAFPGSRFGADNASVYERAIADLDAGETQQAVESLIRSAARLPLVGELRAEVGRLRAERTRLEDASSALAVTRRPSALQAPTAGEWGSVLPAMLEADARHRRMVKAYRKRMGWKPAPEEPCAFLELARRGAKGEDVFGSVRRVLATMGVGGR